MPNFITLPKKKWTIKRITKGDKRTHVHMQKSFHEWFNVKTYPYKTHSHLLAKYCPDYFDQWFIPTKINWKTTAIILSSKYNSRFNDWWTPKKWNWKKHSGVLCDDLFEHFDTWWDADKFNWENDSDALTYCGSKFDTWWDPKKINWKDPDVLENLISNYPDQYDKWIPYVKATLNSESYAWDELLRNFPTKFLDYWDADKFAWEQSVDELIMYAPKHFNIWFNVNKIRYENFSTLASYCSKQFKKWWPGKNQFNYYTGSKHLTRNCSRYFDDWWDESQFNSEHIDTLISKCSKHFDKWWPFINDEEYYITFDSINQLCISCSDNFDTWYSIDLWKLLPAWSAEIITALEKNCFQHKDKWATDAIMIKLEGEDEEDAYY
jgi:hypothetical protein